MKKVVFLMVLSLTTAVISYAQPGDPGVNLAILPIDSLVKNLPSEKALKIIPNPASVLVLVECNEGEKIQIFDSRGSLVLEKKRKSAQESVDISMLKNGTYIVKVGSERLTLIKK